MKTFCPLLSGIDLEGELKKVPCAEHECQFYANVLGTNPQTGQEVNSWACVAVHIPMLLIENSQQQRSTGAAVESFRNEMVRGNGALGALLLAQARPELELIGTDKL